MWKFWKKPAIQDPQFGLLSYSNSQWVSTYIPTTVGSILISFDGDKSGPSSDSLTLARDVLADPALHVEAAMAFVRKDHNAKEFMEHQGDLTLDGFSFFSDQSFYVDFALSGWPDAMINVVFRNNLPCNVLLAD